MRKLLRNTIFAKKLAFPKIGSTKLSSDANSITKVNQRRKQIILIAILTVLAFVIILIIVKGGHSQKQVQLANYNDQRTQAPVTKATAKIDQTFTFPLKDGKGAEKNKINYTIENAELQDEIIVKGQRASAVKGKTFLIINVKIQNNSNGEAEINTRDYIRLTIDNKSDLFAADIHNDPVLVQAISTKPTRLGFPISDAYKKLVLHVGEIQGEKKTININFK